MAIGNRLQPLPRPLMKITTALVNKILGKCFDIVPTTASEHIFSDTAAQMAPNKFLSDFLAIPRSLDNLDERGWKNVM